MPLSRQKQCSYKCNDQPKMSLFVDNTRKCATMDPKQKKMNDALVMYIAADLVPLSVVDSDNFKKLLYVVDPRYQIPSRKHLTSKLITEKADQVHKTLKQQLQHTQHVCVTLDENDRRLQTAVTTRRNSQLNMIRSVLAVPEDKLKRLEGVSSLSLMYRNYLGEMEEILTPFEQATLCVQSEKSSSTLSRQCQLQMCHNA